MSVIDGDILKRVPLALDQAQAPCLLPDGKTRGLLRPQGGRGRHLPRRPRERARVRNLTQDAFYDTDPQVSPDGKLVTYTRRITGHDKVYVFPLANPAQKTQLTFGSYDDNAPIFSPDGNTIFYSSTEDDDIYNLRSLDMRTGVIRQYTDVLGGNIAPERSSTRGATRVGFISYFKGEYKLQSIEIAEPVKEVEQEVLSAAEEVIDFQPDVTHQVVAENKRRKKVFEKLFLEGRPPAQRRRHLQRRLLRRQPDRAGGRAGGQELPAHRGLRARVPQLLRHLPRPRAPAALRPLASSTTRSSSMPRPTTCSRASSARGPSPPSASAASSPSAQYPLDKFRRLELPGRGRAHRGGVREPVRRAAGARGGGRPRGALLPELGNDAPGHA